MRPEATTLDSTSPEIIGMCPGGEGRNDGTREGRNKLDVHQYCLFFVFLNRKIGETFCFQKGL